MGKKPPPLAVYKRMPYLTPSDPISIGPQVAFQILEYKIKLNNLLLINTSYPLKGAQNCIPILRELVKFKRQQLQLLLPLGCPLVRQSSRRSASQGFYDGRFPL